VPINYCSSKLVILGSRKLSQLPFPVSDVASNDVRENVACGGAVFVYHSNHGPNIDSATITSTQ
jgi:hypothetical protein